jgi:glycosyltransferase involved in cell wall biosynthesis
MRILYHHRTRAEDAQGIHIYEMNQAFKNLGHMVDLVELVNKVGSNGKKLNRDFWRSASRSIPEFVYELMELFYNVYGYIALIKQIKKAKPDFIYERYSLYNFCGVLASKRYGIPIILEVNSPLSYEKKRYEKLFFSFLANWSERWICSNASKVIAVSTTLKKILNSEGVPWEQMIVMPNGINPVQFNSGISDEEIRKKYTLNNKTILGFNGWFKKWHGLDILLDLIKDNWKGSNLQVMLIGDGPIFNSLQRDCQAKNIADQITFTGPVSHKDIPRYIATFDIAVIPSATPYASPMKLFEYMAMGKAIAAPRQENILEILDDGEDGLLFDPENKLEFKNALEELIYDPILRKKLGQNAREKIYKRKYLWKENAKKVIDIVEKML